MIVDIICPLYNAEDYIEKLHQSLLNQQEVKINEIIYVLTESSDKTELLLKENNIGYQKISKSEFSHSLVREEQVKKSKADIVCLISQDIVVEDNLWLYHLTKDIAEGEVDATYSRQLTKFNNIEKYTREYNYPANSFIKTKNDIEELGLKTFFFSDAASAVKKSVFIELGGYDGKNLPINEDMYFAYKLIINGGKIKYCADSVVYHSHDFSLKDLYERYKLTGEFFKENKYIDMYETTSSGGSMAKYILKRIIQDKNIKAFFRFPFDMAIRLVGMKVGKK